MQRASTNRLFRFLLRAVLLASFLLVGAACVTLCFHEARPQGAQSPEAERWVDRMWSTLGYDAWLETGAVRWRMAQGRPLFLWDRKRDWVQVRYEDDDRPVDVYLSLETRAGTTLRGDMELPPEESAEWLERAYSDWANDSFWLIAPFKARDPGTERFWAPSDQGEARVLVSYLSGGVTPGDAYLWHLGDDGKPQAWQMWVQVIPVGGIEVRWTQWERLATGVLMARVREGPFGLQMRMDPLDAAFEVPELAGSDPFLPYIERLAGSR